MVTATIHKITEVAKNWEILIEVSELRERSDISLYKQITYIAHRVRDIPCCVVYYRANREIHRP